ncbi:MAG: CCA tRNA nucleotidyltransferase, partial [Roseibium sp.]
MRQITAPWMDHPGARKVMAALTAQGHKAFYVGGCVRNALMGLAAADIDISTDATPDTVIALAAAAGIKSIPTG